MPTPENVSSEILDDDELVTVTGGQKLDPGVPGRSRDRLLAQCGPQIDAYSKARQNVDAHKGDTRAEIDSITAGRSLSLCATNAGFQPPSAWRGIK